MVAEQTLAFALRDAFAETARNFDLAGRTTDALKRVPRSGRVVTIAMGKSAASMTEGLFRAGIACETVVIARPTRSLALADTVRDALIERECNVTSFATAHPIPDDASLHAAEYIRSVLASLTPQDTVIVLLSGGASSSVCLPREGLSLDDLRNATRTLLAHGAPIEAVNAVRGELDAIKHGGLLDLAHGARVHTIIAADVLGDDDTVLHAVGSAPTIASSVALDHTLLALLPPRVSRVAQHHAQRVSADANTTRIVARPADFRDVCARALRQRGLDVSVRSDARTDVDALARAYAQAIASVAPGSCAIAIGEPTVRLPASPGRGGRAGRLALALVHALAAIPGATFCAAASDGVDGESGHAGAVIDSETLASAISRGIDLDAQLAAFDDAVAHEALGTAIDVPPTGLNLLDVHILARA